jgi:glutamate-1-semialdehyde 2,1-aminomutase
VPSAERVLHLPGTEATMMAVRLARAFTGGQLVRFKHHFHGWHDHMTSGYAAISTAARLPASCRGRRRAAAGRAERCRGARPLLGQADDVAAAIIRADRRSRRATADRSEDSTDSAN